MSDNPFSRYVEMLEIVQAYSDTEESLRRLYMDDLIDVEQFERRMGTLVGLERFRSE